MTRFSGSIAVVLVAVLSLLAGGCASVGGDFTYSGPGSIKLGQTKSSEYEALFGSPYSATVKTTAQGKFDEVRYLYAYANMASAQSRLLDLEFRNGLLNAYYFLSSFDHDKTLIQADGFSQIKKGESTKADVMRLLGEPHGKAVSPTEHMDFKDRAAKGAEVWVWTAMGSVSTFGAAYGGQKVTSSSIYLVFDANGVVTDIETEEDKG
jgi:hypothetical protein